MDYKYNRLMKWLLAVPLLMAGLLLAPVQSSAQGAEGDTLFVDWLNDDGTDIERNALRDAILNDTDRPEGRVYKLERGGLYWNTLRIENEDFHLRIVGETAEEADPAASFVCGESGDQDCGPAIIQLVEDEQGEVDTRMITGLGSVTLKNLWITGADNNGVQTSFQPIQIDASNVDVLMQGNVFTMSNFAIPAITGSGNSVEFRDNVFRNLQGRPADQQWQGRGIEITAAQESVIIENNTFFNVNFTSFQMGGSTPQYLRFNQNTIVNNGRQIISGSQWLEAYMTNNLIVNGFWHGEGANDFPADRTTRYAGLFGVGDIPTSVGLNEGRRIAIANNASWRDPQFAEFYADSIVSSWYINDESREFFETYDQIVIQDTMWVAQPNLGTYPDELVPDMWANINAIRTNQIPAPEYFWMEPNSALEISWPLPEDFSYTDDNLLTGSVTGRPLGDLNWFPDEKASWEANFDSEIEAIEAIPGEEVQITPVATMEAEEAAISGDASLQVFDEFSYLAMESGGFMEWTFELEEEGQYDLDVWTHMRGNSVRGQRVIVNGVSIKDPLNFGEYIWDSTGQEGDGSNPHAGMPINEWTWTLIRNEELHESTADALILPAGENTIRIEPSWGFQDFAGINVNPAGTENTVVELRAPDADSDGVDPVCGDAAFCPSNFRWIAAGVEGGSSTATWDVNLEDGGDFLLNVFHQGNSDATVQLSVNGEDVNGSMLLSAAAEGANTSSTQFPLASGNHTFTLTSDDAYNLNFAQLVQVGMAVSIDRPDELVDGYELQQNYPNPFNPSTQINFTLPESGDVSLTVYNLLGQRVAVLQNGVLQSGTHSFEFNAGNLSSGMYFYRLQTDNFSSVRKMTLIK